MNVLIIEDESLAANRLEKLIKKYDNKISVLAKLVSVKETLKWFENNSAPDLIFMDIKLEDGSCFKIFESIKIKAPVIFTTAFQDYMINAFKVNSIDYLLKPINFEELSQSISKFKELQIHYNSQVGELKKLMEILRPSEVAYKNHFLLTIGHKVKTFGIEEIAYFYFDEKTTFIVSEDNQRYPIDYSLDRLTECLNPSLFFRINRQFIIKMSSIENISIHPKSRFLLTLKPKIDKDVIVSGYRYAAFKNWLDS
ncbi:MAG: response regulator transcription factor [Bacteroidetes bacterium]|nr:response regulator transcription factor [Bacteroidota bacterium]